MIGGILAVGFILVAVVLSAGGFAAVHPRYREQMGDLPDFYWTWGTACLIPVGLLVGVPAVALGFNFLILAFGATSWGLNVRRLKEEGAA